jgi:hypothetical protein|nr:MAG TPA: hypothetical protein [Caudoviricetes sp.]
MKRLIDSELMETISNYMNDDIRESLHFALAPCSNEDFLKAYCKVDPDFSILLWSEFRIDMEEYLS